MAKEEDKKTETVEAPATATAQPTAPAQPDPMALSIGDLKGLASIIDVALEPAISTNPYFQFEATVPEAGEFHFTWYDDDGSVYETKKAIKVA